MSFEVRAEAKKAGLEKVETSHGCCGPAAYANHFKAFTKVLTILTLIAEIADLATHDADAAYNMSMVWITATALIIMLLLERVKYFARYYFFTITVSCVVHGVFKPERAAVRVVLWFLFFILGGVLMYAKGFMHADVKLKRDKWSKRLIVMIFVIVVQTAVSGLGVYCQYEKGDADCERDVFWLFCINSVFFLVILCMCLMVSEEESDKWHQAYSRGDIELVVEEDSDDSDGDGFFDDDGEKKKKKAKAQGGESGDIEEGMGLIDNETPPDANKDAEELKKERIERDIKEGKWSAERVFAAFDNDNSGTLDVGELKLALTSLLERDVSHEEATRFASRYDVNGDGVLDFEEFTKCVSNATNSLNHFFTNMFSVIPIVESDNAEAKEKARKTVLLKEKEVKKAKERLEKDQVDNLYEIDDDDDDK
ncbi:hypothetical protein TL16_g01749 [Triparma laevis f. inornata]|uniref:EF-hand domain-containing protein n=1 Tax=Triparma laevis f. inornata TaxID=1714386 RepID=A0A9W7DUJ6_9STRA|nr:hypothetical protein TL16_g01749 [Triparma laevis f. inornata]